MKEKKRKSAMTVYCQSFALYIYNGICSTETRIDKHLLIDLSIIINKRFQKAIIIN